MTTATEAPKTKTIEITVTVELPELEADTVADQVEQEVVRLLTALKDNNQSIGPEIDAVADRLKNVAKKAGKGDVLQSYIETYIHRETHNHISAVVDKRLQALSLHYQKRAKNLARAHMGGKTHFSEHTHKLHAALGADKWQAMQADISSAIAKQVEGVIAELLPPMPELD